MNRFRAFETRRILYFSTHNYVDLTQMIHKSSNSKLYVHVEHALRAHDICVTIQINKMEKLKLKSNNSVKKRALC